jgi:histidinol-phosphate aminotransferase
MKKEHLTLPIDPHVIQAVSWNPPTGRKDFIKLDLNESYHFLDGTIMDELRQFDHFTQSSYPEYDTLLHMLATYTGVPSSALHLVNGSDDGIRLVTRLFFHADDEVVIPAPVFLSYFSALELVGARPIVIPYKKESDAFIFPIEATLAALSQRTKGLLLCNPNNPLGTLIPKKELLRLLERTATLNIPILIDEVYFEFCGETAVPLLERYPHLIILRSFSKSFGLAGVRLGYVLAHEHIIAELHKLTGPWSVNHFATFAGEIVLRHREHFAAKIKESLETKRLLAQLLETRGGCEVTNTATNFLIVRNTQHEALLARFKKANILVNNLAHYPHGAGLLDHTLRISTPSPADLERVKEVLV